MEQIANELKKMVKAGLGAVAAGVEKGQEAIETLAQKGEPIYQQAKSVVSDAVDKVTQAVNDGIQSMNCKPGIEEIISRVKGLTQEEWEQLRAAADDFFAQAKEAARQAAEEETPDGAADADEAVPAKEPEKTPDPIEMAESMRTDDAANGRPEE